MKRRHFLLSAVGFLAVGPVHADGSATLKVAKSPTCGCCTAWVEQMRQAGFATEVENVEQDILSDYKVKLGIAPEFAGCHTATIDGYFVEGHVPAKDIRRLLAEMPKARGLAVPGMPVGSPGMDMGSARDAYEVLLVLEDGSTQVFASYS